MGGWSRNQKMNLGLIALLAVRRAKAERARRAAKTGTATPVPVPKKKRGWFG